VMYWLAFLFYFSGYLCQRPIIPTLPNPRFALIGPTGSGKSSLANAFLGCDPQSKDCLFNVCNDLNSCTKETTYGTGFWLGSEDGQNITVVDTPGFGDSDNQDEELIDEMMDVLANTIDHVDTLVLLLKGDTTRFNAALQKMLKRMTVMFGQDWWNYLVIGVSFWPYDQDSIDDRNQKCDPDYPYYPDSCKDEAWFCRQMNYELKNKTSSPANMNFTCVFTDSWSQTYPNNEDPIQQDFWQIETQNLWDITMDRDEVFFFQTIDDILQENARQRAEIKWLNDVITNNITKLIARMDDSDAERDALGIKIDDLKDEVEDELKDLRTAPIGSIIAWVNKPEKDCDCIRELPDGWVRCDGNAIPEPSPWAGKYTPNLNGGEKRFLRGGMDADVLTMEDDMVQRHAHGVTDNGHDHTVTDEGHNHDVTDGEHHHEVTDNGHEHSVTDTGHTHRYQDYSGPHSDECACNGGVDGFNNHWKTTDKAYTHIKIQKEYTKIEIKNQPSNIEIKDEMTKIKINKGEASITVDESDGEETRPKNMNVIYIMRVW